MIGRDIPKVTDIESLHDSIIARPGISKGRSKGKARGANFQKRQVHWEVVIPSRGDSQIFPELLIYFELE